MFVDDIRYIRYINIEIFVIKFIDCVSQNVYMFPERYNIHNDNNFCLIYLQQMRFMQNFVMLNA